MDVFFTQSMFWGPIRIVFFVLFCYFINMIAIKKSSSKVGLDYFAINYTMMLSYIVLIIFLLTQINGYDLVTLFIILLLLGALTFLDLNWRAPLLPQLRMVKRRFTIYTIMTYEKNMRFIGAKNLKKNKVKLQSKANKKKKWQIGIAIFVAIASLCSRYYFFLFDTYTLSEVWYKELSRINDITAQNWFFHTQSMMGQYAIINFYSQVTGISEAIALTSFSVIESSLLAVLLFWFVNKITDSSFLAGFVTAISFIIFFAFIPLNINLVTQPKSVFLALTLGLPFIAFTFIPQLLSKNTKRLTLYLFVISLAIGFIDLFVFLMVLPAAIIVALPFNWNDYKKERISMLKAYGLAAITLIFIHYIAALIKDYDLNTFINSNLFTYTYTYTPQLVLPFDELSTYYKWLIFIFLIISSLLWKVKKMNFKKVTMVLLFLFILFNLNLFQNSFIDTDTLNLVLSVFIPMFFGVAVFILLRLVKVISINFKLPFMVRIISTIIIISGLALYLENGALTSYLKKNPLNENVLSVYDKMYRDFLPFSYAVVNDQTNFRMGEGSHYFMDYSYFNGEYLNTEEEYHNNKDDESYLNNNPSLIIPENIFIFVYHESVQNNYRNKINLDHQKLGLQALDILKKRDRKIVLFYRKEQLTVYQIINKPNSTDVNDLLF